MLDFIIKYWVQELFVILIALAGFIGKKLWTRYKKGKEQEDEEKLEKHDNKILSQIEKICKSITDRIDGLEKRIENINARNDIQDENNTILKSGILSLQKEQFLRFGKKLLDPDHIISYEEFMAYSQQHVIYNNLGGNHEGDAQFKLVETKYHDALKK